MSTLYHHNPVTLMSSEPDTLVPVIFLYSEGRAAIEGATRFQKLVFIAQEEGNMPEAYDDYRPDRYGPFSPNLHSDILALIEGGYIERDTELNAAGKPKFIYSLTTEGIQVAQAILEKYESLFSVAQWTKEQHNQQPLQQFLQYVYNKYPGYTTATELDLDRLYDPDADTQLVDTPSASSPDTVADQLKPTPHTLYQLPKRDTNAYLYYFTDQLHSEDTSKFKQLDDALTLLGRHRQRLEVVIIDRDRVDPNVWNPILEGLGIDNYPTIVAAEEELGVGDVDLTTDVFTPENAAYAVLESGVLLDSMLTDEDDIRQFLTGLFDAALNNEIKKGMRKGKVVAGLTVAKEEVEKYVTVSY